MASSSNDAPSKRQRSDVELIVSNGLAVAPQISRTGLSRHLATKEVHKYDNIDTPYGKVCEEILIERDGGDPFVFECLNPFALLWLAAARSEYAAEFYAANLKGRCRIVLYCDGVTPGNALRPDHGRTFEAIYWTFLEFPDWYRSRIQTSWFPFCFLESKRLCDDCITMSTVAAAVMKKFFARDLSQPNFERTGLIFQCRGVDHHIVAEFAAWLADERAIKDLVSCKGASGLKPCISCRNVVNRTTPAADGYLVHIDCPETHRFDRQTVDSLNEMVADLLLKHGAVTRAEFNTLEKAYGLVYDSRALLWDPWANRVTRLPDSLYWDWMHCLVASGGIAQYQVNQLLRALCTIGIGLKDVDAFFSQIALPSGRSKLTRNFCQDRVVDKAEAHIRAFASEMISLVQMLGIFADAVVKPAGGLPRHTLCLDRVRELLAILVMGDEACRYTARLKELLHEHHVLYLELYSDCIKPKLHFVKHCVDCMQRFQRNLSCFGPERKHKDAKAVASYAYNKVKRNLALPCNLIPHFATQLASFSPM
jgi:hypothetical protein